MTITWNSWKFARFRKSRMLWKLKRLRLPEVLINLRRFFYVIYLLSIVPLVKTHSSTTVLSTTTDLSLFSSLVFFLYSRIYLEISPEPLLAVTLLWILIFYRARNKMRINKFKMSCVFFCEQIRQYIEYAREYRLCCAIDSASIHYKEMLLGSIFDDNGSLFYFDM